MDKTMSLAAVAREIHENAVAHGWWDGEKEIDEIYALIHSEWSEALEEARAGRDDVWFDCDESPTCTCSKDGRMKCGYYEPESVCGWRGRKPEGVCVEMIDGVIRILDYIGKYDDVPDKLTMDEITNEAYSTKEENRANVEGASVAEVVNALHTSTVLAAQMAELGRANESAMLITTMVIAWQWIKGRGLDPMELLMEKHEYNKTRPYKHGKKF